jgi:hypothetical protein
MLVKLKVTGGLLLILVVCSISAASSSAETGFTTGCPMHQQSVPPHSPIDRHCCQSGHDAAMLQKVANPQRDVLVAVLLRSDRKPVSHDVFALFSDEATSPGTPPAKLQLRI